MASPTEVRKGKVLNYQSNPHLVLDVQHRTQGRQAGFMQVSMRNLNTGASTNTKIRTDFFFPAKEPHMPSAEIRAR